MSRYIFIPGNNPPLSIAELNNRYPNAKLESNNDFLTLTTDKTIGQNEFNNLGGSVKAAEIVSESKKDGVINALSDALSDHYQNTKLDYGLSLYGMSENNLRFILLKLKKSLRKKDIKSRFINNNFQNISSAQYKSISKKGIELVVVKSDNKYLIGKVVGVQNIDAYSKRDFDKPFRDMRMGMLPPKLAQILINLTGVDGKIWDPFCGSGTLVMEGLLQGRDMIGSDIHPNRINGAQVNVDWLKKEFHTSANADLFTHDATEPIDKKFDAIAFEGDLGIPHNQFIKPDKLQGIISDLNELYIKFFQRLRNQKCEMPIVCALPFFRLRDGKEIDMQKTIKTIEDIGFMQTMNHLKYSRENQAVGRAIYKFIQRPPTPPLS